MKHAEFLNLDTKQVQWLDASLEHPNLVRVPDGADTLAGDIRGDCQYFWNHEKMEIIGCGESLKRYPEWESINDTASEWIFILNDNNVQLLWQRNSLQEKINETLSVLNANKAQLSILLGREKSYVKRLLAKNRNVTEKTKATIIDQLDQLISQHEKESENSKCVKKLTATLSVDTKEVQDELKKAYNLIDQANENSMAWQKKYKDQKNLSLFLISIISASIVFLALYCLWGML